MKKYGINSRGSTWRKWDMHVHTPASNGFTGNYEQSYQQLRDAKCDVIGVNDYFSVEGYKTIKGAIDSGELNIGEKQIFPVVEMRMKDILRNRHAESTGGTNVNFHIIFNPQIKIEDIENFIKSLEFNNSTISSDYQDKTFLADVKVDFHSTLLKLSNDCKFKDQYLIWLPYDEYGGIGDIDPVSDKLVKESFIKKSNILGSSNQNQIDFFLWKGDRFLEEEFSEWFGCKKPCIKGSDSHRADYPVGMLQDNNSNPIEKFCWIKADPTFEGLKQIVYEPEDRVMIQEVQPEEKEDYFVIDKIKISDPELFEGELLFNQNLTAIIGGKSTGKSLLLRSIAAAIDSKQVDGRLNEFGLSSFYAKNSIVSWKDGQKSKLDAPIEKKVIYIPQSYINRLVDDNESHTEIDEIVTGVLLQEKNIESVFEQIKKSERGIEAELNQMVDALFYQLIDIQEVSNHIKTYGDKKGIEAEIEKLRKETADLKSKAGMSDDEIKEYNNIRSQIIEMDNDYQSLENSMVVLQNLNELNVFHRSADVDDNLAKLPIEVKSILESQIDRIFGKARTEFIGIINSQINEINDKKALCLEKRNMLRSEIQPLLDKVQAHKLLDDKIKKMDEEEKKLSDVLALQHELTERNNNVKQLIINIAIKHFDFYKIYNDARSKILRQKSITGEHNLQFDIDVIFKKHLFDHEFVNLIFDQRKVHGSHEVILSDSVHSQPEEFIRYIQTIINSAIDDKLPLKSGYNAKDVIRKLLQNWVAHKYKIVESGDEISQMSPGKKSFVILKLLIELDNSKCPILLDQPEDDIDNRSIYSDLVSFIKAKKKSRQIIIVTHNPNLVVATDAECVIVANQQGQESKNKKYKFEYVQGALENTFIDDNEDEALYKQGIKEHVCDILEGGKAAFEKRKNKYNV